MSDLPKGPKALILLVLFASVVLLPGIVSLPALDRDESRYMQASRQMLETGDFVRIRFQDRARNKKPVGIYWLQSASVTMFSAADATARWPYRIPSFLGALAAVLLTFWAGRSLFDRRTGLLGAGLLGTSLLLVIDQHFAKTDAVLLATVIAAQGALGRAYLSAKRGEDAGWANALILWIAVGIGILVKGPITPVVAALTWLGLRIFDRPTHFWSRLRPYAGIALAVLIATPWFIAIILLTDGAFLQESAGRDFFGKLISGQESHGFPPGYYILLMTATFAPASLFVWPALHWALKNRRVEPAVLFCLVWIIPYWVIVELVPTKLPHYILPVYPALALLTARAAFAAQAGEFPRMMHWSARSTYVIWALLVLGFAAAILGLPIGLGEGFQWPAIIALSGAVAAVAFAVPAMWRGRPVQALFAAIILAPFVYGPLFAGVLPATDALWPSREVARAIRAETSGDVPVASAGYSEPSLVFYLGTDTALTGPQAAARHLAEATGAVAIVEDDFLDDFHAAAAARPGLRIEQFASVRGFNYSRGRWVTLSLFRKDGGTR